MLTRRRALQTSAASLGYFLTGPALSAARVLGAADKLRVAGIGVGGKGASDIEQAGSLMQVVALCDVDEQRSGGSAAKFRDARRFTDYRKLFDAMGREFDAVTVSTADHSHAPAAVLAMRAGKHVYCQKPLTHTVAEARLMRETAAKHGVCTQMGNQGSAHNGLRRAVELVQSGLIGNVVEAHVWTNRPWVYWKQAPDYVARPKSTPPVPQYLHWNEWLGTAPERPYAVQPDKKPAYHPHDWRGWWDFGTGALGDMGCHTANMPFRAMGLDAPTAVLAECGQINPETYPAWAHIQYMYPARGKQPAVTLHWYEGKKDGQRVLPPADLVAKLLKPGEKLSDSGSIIVGQNATLFSPNDYGASFRFFPDEIGKAVQTKVPEKLPLGVNKDEDHAQKAEWVLAIKAANPKLAYSNFDFAARLTEAMLLGNIAVRFAGEKLEWDAAKLAFTNSRKATALVSKEYRKGWELPGI
ncbi:MAG TPA: Gfo/Idh/MocA family oxidoreductase [Urbifossiella sp.]|nr:Gfo/Idh/MocA family oxidoreductase [Urbifossiella sp.]